MTGMTLTYSNMSRKSLIGVEGDHVEYTHCTCVPSLPPAHDIEECHGGRNHLKNWKKWMTRRKQIHGHLSKALQRPAGDLLMNLDEKHRKYQAERLIFGYCRINTYFDKSRGNPAFWKVPTGLYDKSVDPQNPIYLTNTTKVEQNEIPVVKYVGTPNYIKDEKNIFPSERPLYFTHSKGKCKNTEILSSKINQITLHQPECEELIVLGKKIGPPKPNAPRTIRIHSEVEPSPLPKEEERGEEKIPQDSLEEISPPPRICFTINETLICGYNELQNSLMKIRLIYECTKDKSPEVKYLKFINRGLTTIRFYWNRIEKFVLFRDLIRCDRDDCQLFAFNNNELLLGPEETIDFPVWFTPNEIGNYIELWEIITKPKVWDDNFKLILNLQAYVYPCGFEEKFKYINERLDERAGKTVIRGCLNDILLHLKFNEFDTDVFYFKEKQIFESANQEIWGIESRPKYVYDSKAVIQLKLLYEEIKTRCDPKHWNYSINDLKMMARKKDIWVYVENETKEMLKGRQRRILLNTLMRQENEENNMQPIDVELEVVGPSKTYRQHLDDILEGLEQPSIIPNTERSKYFTVYCILRNFCFKISYALARYENPHDAFCDDYYACYDYRGINMVEQLPDRLLFERFDDVWMDRMKKSQLKNEGDLVATPKPDVLKGISTENYRTVYKLYFNIADTVEKDKKGKVVVKPEEKVVKDQEKIIKHRNTTNVDQMLSMMSKEGFDPFAEEYVPNIFEREPKPQWEVRQFIYRSSCDYMKFLIVYTYLIEAVEAIVDAMESFKENTLDIEVLGELTKCIPVNIVELQHLPKEDCHSLVSHEEEDAGSLKIENDPYFHNLMDSHLNKNLYTKEYLIEGKRKVSREESIPVNCQDTSESDSLSSFVIKFRETIEEQSIKSTASAEVQTSEVHYNFKDRSDEFLKNELSLTSTSSSSTKTFSDDVFYFVDDEKEAEEKEKTNT